jgi:hypothetical protein
MTSELRELSAQWLEAKQAENTAKARRLAIEQAIVDITGTRETGQMTVTAADAKIVVKVNETYKFDWAEYDRLANQIPSHLQPVKTRREPDPAGLRWLRENRPAIYAALAPALTRTITKPSIEITLLGE